MWFHFSFLVQLVFDYFRQRTPQSYIEIRDTALVWNYKYAGMLLWVFATQFAYFIVTQYKSFLDRKYAVGFNMLDVGTEAFRASSKLPHYCFCNT